MKKLVLLKGLQASGKSSWANNEAKDSMSIVLNKDTIRQELHKGVYSKSNEKEVVAYERWNVESLMMEMYPYIIVDNTHLGTDNPHIAFYKNLASQYWYEVEVKEFDTPLWECIERDSKREWSARVGAKVILDTYNKYCVNKNINSPKLVQDKSLPEAYIFDIDWTLAHMSGRSPYDYSKVWTDIVDKDVRDLLKIIENTWREIIIVSWRKDDCRDETIEWISDNVTQYFQLFMRKSDDSRCDSIVKREIAEKYILPKCNVRGVFDDRDRVVKAWREMGLTCFQVAYWDF